MRKQQEICHKFRYDPVAGTGKHSRKPRGKYKERHHKSYGCLARMSNLGFIRKKVATEHLKAGWYEGEPLRSKPERCWKSQRKTGKQWKT